MIETKEVVSRRNREHYLKNREKILGYKKKHRDANREIYNARARTKRASALIKAHDYLKRKYGLTLVEYQSMLEAQGGKCAVCRASEPGRRFAVDHCHFTGKIRGLLCAGCNTAIGRLNDDPILLEKAAEYLRRNRE